MAFRRRVDKRLLKKEKTYETDQLMKEKRSEEYEVLARACEKMKHTSKAGVLVVSSF